MIANRIRFFSQRRLLQNLRQNWLSTAKETKIPELPVRCKKYVKESLHIQWGYKSGIYLLHMCRSFYLYLDFACRIFVTKWPISARFTNTTKETPKLKIYFTIWLVRTQHPWEYVKRNWLPFCVMRREERYFWNNFPSHKHPAGASVNSV